MLPHIKSVGLAKHEGLIIKDLKTAMCFALK